MISCAIGATSDEPTLAPLTGEAASCSCARVKALRKCVGEMHDLTVLVCAIICDRGQVKVFTTRGWWTIINKPVCSYRHERNPAILSQKQTIVFHLHVSLVNNVRRTCVQNKCGTTP